MYLKYSVGLGFYHFYVISQCNPPKKITSKNFTWLAKGECKTRFCRSISTEEIDSLTRIFVDFNVATLTPSLRGWQVTLQIPYDVLSSQYDIYKCRVQRELAMYLRLKKKAYFICRLYKIGKERNLAPTLFVFIYTWTFRFQNK
jgi:hypothetical protein